MPIFILGAGFNADAAAEAGVHRSESSYPLVGDTLGLCFGFSELPKGKSIECLFSDAQEFQESGPISKLADRLMSADQEVAGALAIAERANCYQQFFQAFSDSTFLTFNYDSLPETILFRLRCWFPWDGYGVKVRARLPPVPYEFGEMKSTTRVLHLHGSLCIRASVFEEKYNPGEMATVSERDQPLYAFDPESTAGNFAPIGRFSGDYYVQERVIAPVLDKSRGLQRRFILDTYAIAADIVRNSDMVVAIGYSFNDHDRASYQELLDALRNSKGRRLLVVSPDADKVAQTIRRFYSDLSIVAVSTTFKKWVAESFTGMNLR